MKDPAAFSTSARAERLGVSTESVFAGTHTLINSPVTVNEGVKKGGDEGH